MSWNQAGGKGAEVAPEKKARLGRWLATTGIMIAVLAGGAVYFLATPEIKAKLKKENGPAKIAEAQADLERQPQEVTEEPVESEADRMRRERAEKMSKMTVEERIDYIFDETAKRPINLEPATNRVFATGTEQVLSWIFTTRLGDAPPPLPEISIHDEAHLAEILMAANTINDDDSESAKDAKEMVMLAKEELKKFIKEGGYIEDFLEYYRGELVQAHNEWRESQRQVMEVMREEPELAADFVEEVNKRLHDKGIKPVSTPPQLLEKYGVELYE